MELLVLEPHKIEQTDNKNVVTLECLIKGKVKSDLEIKIDIKSKYNIKLKAHLLERIEGGRFRVEFETENPLQETLTKYGQLPLPPYIKKELEVPERYQTVYARYSGSAAAPTSRPTSSSTSGARRI